MTLLSLLSILALPSLLSVNILLFSSLTAAQKDNGSECDCFKTNGSSADYYAYHRFHDFRNINKSLASNPEVFTDAANTSNADATSAFFLDKIWTDDWQSQSWNNSDSMSVNNASILMINSPNNIYICSYIYLLHSILADKRSKIYRFLPFVLYLSHTSHHSYVRIPIGSGI